MSTRPCPHCHEIIPIDLDYCPFCNQNTRELPQSADDAALTQQRELREAGMEDELPPDSVSEESTSGIPPRPSVDRCIMCNMVPSTVGDYCVDCRNKLDMGPEQWDLAKQDAQRRKAIVGSIVAVVVLLLLIALVSKLHHGRPAAAPAPTGAAARL